MMWGWNFRELASFIEYKAALAQVPVVYVDPKETCGNVSRYNWKKQSWFRCVRCGYQSDAVPPGGSMLSGHGPGRKGT
ncbi:MAG: zinc ribbon domain-containing protein [Bacillota bacterium]